MKVTDIRDEGPRSPRNACEELTGRFNPAFV